MTGPSGPRLVGGVVAFRDGPRVATALRSLLAQELPAGAEWTRIWAIVSPDDRGTVRSAQVVAAEDARVAVVVEAERRGKAAALEELFRRAAGGDLLVLLNGDAEAAPGAVGRLLAVAEGAGPSFGVMGRPRVRDEERGVLADALRLLWALHHQLHTEAGARGAANHLSDELWLLPIAHLPPLRAGTITDGAFCGMWLHRHGGVLRYAPDADVRISIPAHLRGHLTQRRRILLGHRQVGEGLGTHPLTIDRLARAEPGAALRMIGAEIRRVPHGLRGFALLATMELLALLLSRFDARQAAADAAVWTRVPTVAGYEGTEPPARPTIA